MPAFYSIARKSTPRDERRRHAKYQAQQWSLKNLGYIPYRHRNMPWERKAKTTAIIKMLNAGIPLLTTAERGMNAEGEEYPGQKTSYPNPFFEAVHTAVTLVRKLPAIITQALWFRNRFKTLLKLSQYKNY